MAISPPTLGVGGEMDYFVKALTASDGKSIADGDFSISIAPWNGTIWQPVGNGMDNAVFAPTVSNGHLIAGRYFAIAGGAGTDSLANWNSTTWQMSPHHASPNPAAMPACIWRGASND